jgi:hypothetical protein
MDGQSMQHFNFENCYVIWNSDYFEREVRIPNGLKEIGLLGLSACRLIFGLPRGLFTNAPRQPCITASLSLPVPFPQVQLYHFAP